MPEDTTICRWFGIRSSTFPPNNNNANEKFSPFLLVLEKFVMVWFRLECLARVEPSEASKLLLCSMSRGINKKQFSKTIIHRRHDEMERFELAELVFQSQALNHTSHHHLNGIKLSALMCHFPSNLIWIYYGKFRIFLLFVETRRLRIFIRFWNRRKSSRLKIFVNVFEVLLLF